MGVLKRVNPLLLIIPLKKAQMDTILHRIAHAPTKGEDLENYLKYKMGNFQMESIFKI